MWRTAAAGLDLPPGLGEYGASMDGPDKAWSILVRQMLLPLRHGGLGLRMHSDEVLDAALCPLQGASGASVREQWGKLHERYAELCHWDAASKHLPTEFLDSRNGPLGAQHVTRKGDGACHADMLSVDQASTSITQGQQDAA